MAKTCEYTCDLCGRSLINNGIGVEFYGGMVSCPTIDGRTPLRLCELDNYSENQFCWFCLRGLVQAMLDYEKPTQKESHGNS